MSNDAKKTIPGKTLPLLNLRPVPAQPPRLVVPPIDLAVGRPDEQDEKSTVPLRPIMLNDF